MATASDESNYIDYMDTEDSGNATIHGSLTVEGNLGVQGQTTTNGLKVVDDDGNFSFGVDNARISFRKVCQFAKPVEFNNGHTIIGMEGTYDSAYVCSPTIHAKNRLILGDSNAKWEVTSH